MKSKSSFALIVLCTISLPLLLLAKYAQLSSLRTLNKARNMRIASSMLSDGSASPLRVAVVGATGYIGKYVVQESVRRGYDTVAVVREGKGREPSSEKFFKGATLLESEVTDESRLMGDLAVGKPVDIVISCLASRSGTKSDSYLIDYQATLNSLNAAKKCGAKQFILLSAFCVRKPLLEFQRAKLKFEAELTKAGDNGEIKYSIVRPTAFFKSVSGQLELLQQGWPFVMFGDGEICQCNPIAESDLASYMLDCVTDQSKWNKILDIGGPDNGMTMKQQGEMIFDILGKEPKFWTAPVSLFDAIINFLAFLGRFSDKASDAAELARIGKYYAVEDMLTVDESERYGKTTLRQHYERIAVEGQEYDPYTTMLAPKK